MPYLDTLCYCSKDYILSNTPDNNLLFTFNNSIGSKFIYLKDKFNLKTIKNSFEVNFFCKDDVLNQEYFFYNDEEETEYKNYFYQQIFEPILNNKLFINDNNIDIAILRSNIFNFNSNEFLGYAFIWKNTNYKKPILGFINTVSNIFNNIGLENSFIREINDLIIDTIYNKAKEKNITPVNELIDRRKEITYQINFNLLKKINLIKKDWVDFFNFITPLGKLVLNFKSDQYYDKYSFDYESNVKLTFYDDLALKNWDNIISIIRYEKIKDIINFFKKILKKGKENYTENIGKIYFLEKDNWNNTNKEFEGIFLNSIWENGTFKNGFMYKSVWKNGTFNDGRAENIIWENGTFNDGQLINSIWKDGTLNNGILVNVTWEGGELFRNGIIRKTTWKNGIFHKEGWWDDKYSNNTWIKGKIECKKFQNNYVETKLNPNRFWEIEEKSSSFEEFIKKVKEEESKNF